jgi:hypothetical protein
MGEISGYVNRAQNVLKSTHIIGAGSNHLRIISTDSQYQYSTLYPVKTNPTLRIAILCEIERIVFFSMVLHESQECCVRESHEA